MHKLTVDHVHNIVEARLWGCMAPGDVARYGGDLQKQFAEHRLRPGYRMLLDVSECGIQPKETITAFQEHVRRAPQSNRIAVITGSSMIRMQVRRVMKQDFAKLFDSRAEGLAWLVRPDLAAA